VCHFIKEDKQVTKPKDKKKVASETQTLGHVHHGKKNKGTTKPSPKIEAKLDVICFKRWKTCFQVNERQKRI